MKDMNKSDLPLIVRRNCVDYWDVSDKQKKIDACVG